MKSDLVKKPFTLDFVKKLVKLTRNGVVTSSIAGIIGYQGLRDRIEYSKKRLVKLKQLKAKIKAKKQKQKKKNK